MIYGMRWGYTLPPELGSKRLHEMFINLQVLGSGMIEVERSYDKERKEDSVEEDLHGPIGLTI